MPARWSRVRRLRLSGLTAEAERRLSGAGQLRRDADWCTVSLAEDEAETAIPALVRDLVGLGVAVHAVEPARISLEDRLLGILRTGAEGGRP